MLGMTNRPWLQRETGQTRDLADEEKPVFSPPEHKNRAYASVWVSD